MHKIKKKRDFFFLAERGDFIGAEKKKDAEMKLAVDG